MHCARSFIDESPLPFSPMAGVFNYRLLCVHSVKRETNSSTFTEPFSFETNDDDLRAYQCSSWLKHLASCSVALKAASGVAFVVRCLLDG